MDADAGQNLAAQLAMQQLLQQQQMAAMQQQQLQQQLLAQQMMMAAPGGLAGMMMAPPGGVAGAAATAAGTSQTQQQAAERKQREIYIGNLSIGTMSPELLREFFDAVGGWAAVVAGVREQDVGQSGHSRQASTSQFRAVQRHPRPHPCPPPCRCLRTRLTTRWPTRLWPTSTWTPQGALPL